MALIALAQFMVIMDTSIIGVALPRMQTDLGFAPENLTWVFNAYVIALGGMLLLGGRLADLFGARRMFSTGWVITLAGSVVAAAAGTAWVELAGRVLQGDGAALIAPAALTLLMMTFGDWPRELTKALAVYGAAAPAGGTAGVFLAGVIIEWLSWPWIFWLYVPISLLAIVVTPRLLPVAARRRGSIDAAGAAVVAIVRAPETGWGSVQTVVLLAGAVALLGLFVVVQRTRRVPLVRLGLFRTPNLGGANLAQFLLGAAWIPMWYFLNLYLQQVLGYGALASGAALLPNDPRLLTTALTTADNAKPRIKANRISHIMDPARVSACPIAPAMSTSSAMGELTERWRRRASNGEKPRGDGWAMSYTPVPPRG